MTLNGKSTSSHAMCATARRKAATPAPWCLASATLVRVGLEAEGDEVMVPLLVPMLCGWVMGHRRWGCKGGAGSQGVQRVRVWCWHEAFECNK